LAKRLAKRWKWVGGAEQGRYGLWPAKSTIPREGTVDTRTIAIAALVVAVAIAVILFVL